MEDNWLTPAGFPSHPRVIHKLALESEPGAADPCESFLSKLSRNELIEMVSGWEHDQDFLWPTDGTRAELQEILKYHADIYFFQELARQQVRLVKKLGYEFVRLHLSDEQRRVLYEKYAAQLPRLLLVGKRVIEDDEANLVRLEQLADRIKSLEEELSAARIENDNQDWALMEAEKEIAELRNTMGKRVMDKIKEAVGGPQK